MRSLDGRVAVIVGGGRGFGRAIAERFGEEGAAVVIVARTKAQVDDLAARLRNRGQAALGIAGDMAVRADVERTLEVTKEAFGTPDILIDCAGVPGPFGPISECDPDEWWQALSTHLRVPTLLLHTFLPEMQRSGRGHIVIISSLAGTRVVPNLSAYCVGKNAQNRLVEHVALEVKEHGVSVFAIEPGTVHTDLLEATLVSPEAQRWLPGLVRHMQGVKENGDITAGLAHCAQRCLDLVSGCYDTLSGRYLLPEDDLNQLVAREPAALMARTV